VQGCSDSVAVRKRAPWSHCSRPGVLECNVCIVLRRSNLGSSFNPKLEVRMASPSNTNNLLGDMKMSTNSFIFSLFFLVWISIFLSPLPPLFSRAPALSVDNIISSTGLHHHVLLLGLIYISSNGPCYLLSECGCLIFLFPCWKSTITALTLSQYPSDTVRRRHPSYVAVL